MLKLERNSTLIVLKETLTGAAFGLWAYILPVHLSTIGATPRQVGITLSVMGFSALMVVIPVGILADRVDRRKLMIAITIIPAIPTALLGLTTQWQFMMVLLLFIHIQGSVTMVINSYLVRILSSEDLTRAFANISFGFLIGQLIFRTVGGRIAEASGMSVVFALGGLFFALSAVPLLFIDKQPAVSQGTSIDYQNLLRSRRFQVAIAFIFILLLVMDMGVALVPNYLEQVVKLDLSKIGQLGTIAALGGALLALLAGRIRGRGGFIFAQLSIILAFGLFLRTPTPILLPISLFLMGGREAMYPLVETLISQAAPLHMSGLAFGVMGLLTGASWLVGPIAAGFLYEITPQSPMTVAVIGLVVLGVVTLILPMTKLSSNAT
jgi:MFS family permease